DGGSTVYFPFKDFTKDALNDFLENQKIALFIRPHHLDQGHKSLMDLPNVYLVDSGFIDEISFYLHHFCVLVTDYSSIALDFLLTGGTTMYIPYDLKDYEQSRGVN